MNKIVLSLVALVAPLCLWAQIDESRPTAENPIKSSDSHLERIYTINDKYKDVVIVVNAPLEMDAKKKTKIIIYALPNGNDIEYTAGKVRKEEEDFRYDVQHIAAQTRWLRENKPQYNYVTAYLQASMRSWGTWRRLHRENGLSAKILPAIIQDIADLYKPYNPSITLSSHSGGGYFIFEYLRVADKINPLIERIAFLDSTYGYEEEDYKEKLTAWLKNKKHYLNVTSYQDSTVIYNGKPLVSPTGGTWWRSQKMQRDLAEKYKFEKVEDDTYLNFYANDGQITITLVKNPTGAIYHTVLVEKNGFIDSFLSGTSEWGKGYQFWGDRVYNHLIKKAPMIKQH